jgi:hypothetical protein
MLWVFRAPDDRFGTLNSLVITIAQTDRIARRKIRQNVAGGMV